MIQAAKIAINSPPSGRKISGGIVEISSKAFIPPNGRHSARVENESIDNRPASHTETPTIAAAEPRRKPMPCSVATIGSAKLIDDVQVANNSNMKNALSHS